MEVSVQAGREVHVVIHRVNGTECVQRMRSHVWIVWERMVQMETYGCKLALGVGAAGSEAD